MQIKQEKHRILILGGSGFIGNALYKELYPYFDLHATYCSKADLYKNNHVFYKYCFHTDSVTEILKAIRPTLIISALRGDFDQLTRVHRELTEYLKARRGCTVFFLSSAAVFDAKTSYPAYEYDLPLSNSKKGKYEIKIERMLLKNLPHQVNIIRLPLILGVNSPAIFHLRQCIRHQAEFEVFPNRVITATTISKVCQQIHYIINQNLNGIFHLASNDMIHHDELFLEIITKTGAGKPILKNVYTSNEDRYAAILPKLNQFPKNFQIAIPEVIENSILREEIYS